MGEQQSFREHLIQSTADTTVQSGSEVLSEMQFLSKIFGENKRIDLNRYLPKGPSDLIEGILSKHCHRLGSDTSGYVSYLLRDRTLLRFVYALRGDPDLRVFTPSSFFPDHSLNGLLGSIRAVKTDSLTLVTPSLTSLKEIVVQEIDVLNKSREEFGPGIVYPPDYLSKA